MKEEGPEERAGRREAHEPRCLGPVAFPASGKWPGAIFCSFD